jgi:hypothetical protein
MDKPPLGEVAQAQRKPDSTQQSPNMGRRLIIGSTPAQFFFE